MVVYRYFLAHAGASRYFWTQGYFWPWVGTFGLMLIPRVVFGAHGYFWERTGTFGHAQVRLGADYFFWHVGTFGCVWVLLGASG